MVAVGVAVVLIWPMDAFGSDQPRAWRHSLGCNHGSRSWTPAETKCGIRRGFIRYAQQNHLAASNWKEAIRVADCETGGTFDYRARNGQYAGVWQISRAYHEDAPSRFSPASVSVWVAQVTRGGTNWSSWECGWAAG